MSLAPKNMPEHLKKKLGIVDEAPASNPGDAGCPLSSLHACRPDRSGDQPPYRMYCIAQLHAAASGAAGRLGTAERAASAHARPNCPTIPTAPQ